MSDLENLELAILRVRDAYQPGEFYDLLDRLAMELRRRREDFDPHDPHHGLGRSGSKS